MLRNVVVLILVAPLIALADSCPSSRVFIASPRLPDFSGPSDNFPVGEQISSLAASSYNSIIVNCRDQESLIGSGRLYPELSDAGVTWVFLGRNFPVYKTPIPGIGVAIGFKDPNADEWIPLVKPYAKIFPADGTPDYEISTLGGELKIWYISLGGLASGLYTVPAMTVATLTAHKMDGSTLAWVDVMLGGNSINVEAQGCVLQSNTVGVELGRFKTIDFNGVGSAAPPSHFSIVMECDPDIGVNLTVSDANAINSGAGIIGLSASEQSAVGVGIQLMEADGLTPIVLGEEKEMLISTEGQNRINLSARYYQVDEQIQPGSVNAVANFSVRYK